MKANKEKGEGVMMRRIKVSRQWTSKKRGSELAAKVSIKEKSGRKVRLGNGMDGWMAHWMNEERQVTDET